MKQVHILFLFLLTSCSLVGQSIEEIKRQRDSIYKVNITKTRLNGVYIPKDLDDAFAQLDKLSSQESLSKFQNAPEEVVAKKLHFGLGRWMAYNWNFDEGSRFSHYLRKMGLSTIDHMINFMLISYHRYLNKVPQDYENRINIYKEQIEKEKREMMEKGEIISTQSIPIVKKQK